MRKVLLIITVFFSIACQAQNIEGYEYWFNDSSAEKTVVALSPESRLQLNTSVSTGGLSDGVQVLYFRAWDNNSTYSSTVRHFFYKLSLSALTANTITGYEYWIDDDFAEKVYASAGSQQQLILDMHASSITLAEGVHTLNIRFRDNNNTWSSILRRFFYVVPLSQFTASGITRYEYWFDNDFAGRVASEVGDQQQLVMNIQADCSSMAEGSHRLNFRFRDSNDMWSSVINHTFYRMPASSDLQENKITRYRYWFDNDIEGAAEIVLNAPLKQLSVNDDISLVQIPAGIHTINFQFADSLNIWSVVTTDTIVKNALPIADFTYSVISYCDSSVVSFTNNSIDCDSVYWDFADGTSGTDYSPEHIYYAPGEYTVTLTVTDKTTMADSTVQHSFSLTGNTYNSFTSSVCGSYVSPSGLYTWTTSGTYNDTIPNHFGCDSILTVDLTVHPVYNINENIDVCSGERYTFPDGYTENAVFSNISHTSNLSSQSGCDSTVVTQLNVTTVNTGVTQDQASLTAAQDGAAYRWLNCSNGYSVIAGATGRTYVAQASGSYAVEITLNNCRDTSACVQVSLTGIDDYFSGEEIKIYPNPTDGKFTLELKNSLPESVLIISTMEGEIITREIYRELSKTELFIDRPSGIYFVTVICGNNVYRLKLVKN